MDTGEPDRSFFQENMHRFIDAYQSRPACRTRWLQPLIGFSSAHDPLFHELKTAVCKTHALPADLLTEAQSVLSYFIPFERSVAKSNEEGSLASMEWAVAYVETNALILELGMHVRRLLEKEGHAAEVIPATGNFHRETLLSDWSHRHAAFIAGLGRFGANNMLITDKGCCGRFGTIVTSLVIKADERKERWGWKHTYCSTCLLCVERCPGSALGADHFDRFACFDMCCRNEEVYRDLGKAYVCGKCLSGLPCSWKDPSAGKMVRARRAADGKTGEHGGE